MSTTIKNKKEFINYFEKVIRPKYDEKVRKYARASKNFQIIMGFWIVGIISMYIIPSLIWGDSAGSLGFLIAILLIVCSYYFLPVIPYTFKYLKENEFSKDKIFNDILPKIVSGYTFSNKSSITKEEFIDYKLITESFVSRFRSEDSLIGKMGSFDVRFSEAKSYQLQEQGENSQYIKKFDGMIVEIDMNIDPYLKVIISKKEYSPDRRLRFELAGTSEEESVRNLEEISLSNLHMDDNYTIMTNNTDKAYQIFEPRVVRNFVDLLGNEEQDISIGITMGKIVLLMENEVNLFEIFEKDKFDPEVIWDEIHEAFKWINYLRNLNIDYKRIVN